MGLRPTKGDEKRPLSSDRSLLCHPEAKPRDLQFRGPFLEMFFDRSVPGFPATQHWTKPRVRLSL
jgi:hypothetical protein